MTEELALGVGAQSGDGPARDGAAGRTDTVRLAGAPERR